MRTSAVPAFGARILGGFLIATLALGSVGHAELAAAPEVRGHAVRRRSAISIDGRLDEAGWSDAPRHAGFVQRFPKDGGQPSVQTEFSILYDDDAVFVGVWADDPRPDLIRRLLTRRDVDGPADAVTVAFDSYHDRRTAYAFQLNAAGVQRDVLMFDDTNQDDTWDAVWTGEVAMTPRGWTAEYRIPLGQLRFSRSEVQEWGFQVVRLVGRTGEQDAWSPWPRSAPQVVSRFGVVGGIDHLEAATRLELLPYASAGFARTPVLAGDPLDDGHRWSRNAGLDFKYGLGPAFTISATLNPDFGQVEADPSKINLSANELFFAEKRPFFLEGIDLFKLPIGNADNAVEGAFYSRRIGATPTDATADGDVEPHRSTVIYGAAKLTGKTATGWSIGLLDAVTGQDTAALTNYAIASVKRDFGEGKTSVGWSATAVNRKLGGTPLEPTLHDQAYTGGMQLLHRWADNAWTAHVTLVSSWVHGSQEAIAATQNNALRYFQRPDARDAHFDPTRTRLAGYGAKWLIGRLGDSDHWRYGFGGDLRTPGLELNDAGFQQIADRVVPFVSAEYRENAPSQHVLNWALGGDVFWVNNFEPRLLEYGLEYNGNVQLSNYWQLAGGGNVDRARWSTTMLRGGRTLRVDPANNNYLSVSTDTRKALRFSLAANSWFGPTSGSREGGLDLGATIQARSNLDIFVGPSVYLRDDPMQYVAELDTDQAHFVFARIHETDVSMTLRVNWAFSPHLTLQAYAQPYVASVRYDEFKEVDHPGAARYADRFRMLDDGELAFTGSPAPAAFVLARPDLNFRQLRSTVVVRWEYRPGSTVFAIWSHGQTDDTFDDGRFHIGRDLSALGHAASETVVMVKANYWIGL